MVRYSASGGEVIRQNENPARVRGSGQGLGNPHLVGVRRAMLREFRVGKRTGALEVPHATSGTKSARRGYGRVGRGTWTVSASTSASRPRMGRPSLKLP